MKIFNLPDLGEGLAEAEIRQWHVHVGDTVNVDQPMVSVETAKAVVDVPAPFTGKILKLFGNVGECIKTHAPLVEFSSERDQGSVVGLLEEGGGIYTEPTVEASSIQSQKKGTAVKVMPTVRALARRLGVDLELVEYSGDHITSNDVELAAKNVQQNKQLNNTSDALHGLRRSMAQIMTRSGHTVVPATLMDNADVTEIKTDFTVSLIQSMVAAATSEPALNATFSGESLSRTLHETVNIGLAINSAEGLLVPVIKNAGRLAASELRSAINSLKQGAEKRTLAPAELQDATIMLSNFGTIAGRYASPVLVPPLVAILGCGKVYDAVVPLNGKICIRKLAPLSLTFDHRAVTGSEASRFLVAVIQFLQQCDVGTQS